MDLFSGANDVSVTVGENGRNETRYARITLVKGNEKLGITVHQAGVIVKGFTPSDKVVNYRAQTLEFPYSSNAQLKVATTAPWITVEQDEGLFRLLVAENSAGDGIREGVVSWTLGAQSGEFKVIQNPEFREQPGWALSYSGRMPYRASVYEQFTCTVDPSIAGKPYALLLVTEKEFNGYGLSMADYVDTYGWKKSLTELQDFLALLGGEATLAELLFTDSATDIFALDEFPPGRHWAIAIGFDNNGVPTGEYAATLCNTGNVGYDYWLGRWSVTDNNNQTYVVTVAEKEAGSSYTLTGIRNYPFPTTAVFNADGTLTLKGASTVSLISEPYSVSTYLFSAIWSQGLATADGSTNYFFTGSDINIAMIARADENTAVMNGYWFEYSSAWYQYIRHYFRGPASNNGAAEANTNLAITYFPATLTRVTE